MTGAGRTPRVHPAATCRGYRSDMSNPVVAVERVQSPAEELVNAISHGVGAVIGAVALVWMVILASGPLELVAGGIHGSSAVALFSASTVYHAVRRPRAKEILQAVDHVAVHGLIAGTYTPFALLALGGARGWGLFAAVWTLAIAGMVFEARFTNRYPRISTVLYLATGWVGILAVGPLLSALPVAAVLWLLAGGLSYTVGVWFFVKDGPYHHALWHGFVIAGAVCHFVASLGYVL